MPGAWVSNASIERCSLCAMDRCCYLQKAARPNKFPHKRERAGRSVLPQSARTLGAEAGRRVEYSCAGQLFDFGANASEPVS